MSFKDGEDTGRPCPKEDCEGKLFYEMSFADQFSERNGHYTTDVPLCACDRCDYSEDYFEYEYENDGV